MTVLVEKAVFVPFADEDGNDLVEVDENGDEYLVCQVWYYLGKVISTENVPEDYYYDTDTKAERLRILKEMEAEREGEVEG